MKAIDWKGQNIAWKKLRKVSINGNLSQDHVLEELILLRRKNWIPKFQLPFLAWKLTVQFNSVAQLCPTLCNPMDCSIPGLPVHHQLQEFTQTHVHWAIQPSHPLSSPFHPAFNLSQHQGLFKWDSSSHQVAKVLEFQLQHQTFQWILKSDLF